MKSFRYPSVALVICIALSACSKKTDLDRQSWRLLKPSQTDIQQAEVLKPKDPKLALVYDRSCSTCHSLIDSKAPLVGHKSVWDLLIKEKGVNGLLMSAKNGYQNMPSMGFCADCSDEQLTALILFMAAREE